MQPIDIAIPTLPSRSVEATMEFYRKLGFDGKIWGQGRRMKREVAEGMVIDPCVVGW